MRQAKAVRQEPARADIIARCEGAEYLVLGQTERGAHFVRKAPAMVQRRDGGIVASPENVALMVEALAQVGMVVRRIEQ